MDQSKRWALLNQLDEELLIGGVQLSEWCVFIVRDADTAFVHGAHLASILTAVAGVETHLRSLCANQGRLRLVDLIDQAGVDDSLRQNLHTLRKYRNKWVHVADPHDDAQLLTSPETAEEELERMAYLAVRCLRATIYSDQWV